MWGVHSGRDRRLPALPESLTHTLQRKGGEPFPGTECAVSCRQRKCGCSAQGEPGKAASAPTPSTMMVSFTPRASAPTGLRSCCGLTCSLSYSPPHLDACSGPSKLPLLLVAAPAFSSGEPSKGQFTTLSHFGLSWSKLGFCHLLSKAPGTSSRRPSSDPDRSPRGCSSHFHLLTWARTT